MRIGANVSCDAPQYVELSKKIGFDFLEANFQHIARGDKSSYESYKKAIEEFDIRCETSNCLMPGDIPVVGENVDYNKVREYLDKGLYNGAAIGLKKIIFGSGAARRLPDGFSFKKGIEQLKYFLAELASPMSSQYGIQVVIEPLHKGETNMINLLSEGVILASLTGKDNVSTLADTFHMHLGNEPFDNIRALKGEITHAHISYPFPLDGKDRCFPSSGDEYDYKGFVDALKFAGCKTIAIEAATYDFAKDAPITFEVIRQLLK